MVMACWQRRSAGTREPECSGDGLHVAQPNLPTAGQPLHEALHSGLEAEGTRKATQCLHRQRNLQKSQVICCDLWEAGWGCVGLEGISKNPDFGLRVALRLPGRPSSVHRISWDTIPFEMSAGSGEFLALVSKPVFRGVLESWFGRYGSTQRFREFAHALARAA